MFASLLIKGARIKAILMLWFANRNIRNFQVHAHAAVPGYRMERGGAPQPIAITPAGKSAQYNVHLCIVVDRYIHACILVTLSIRAASA